MSKSPSLFARWLLLSVGLLSMPGLPAQEGGGSAPRYNRDIQPILSRHCFACHGPDAKKRKAKLRLDLREEALAAGAIVPGDLDASELIRRLDCEDPEELMPPIKGGEPLNSEQKDLLKRWVAAGAPYEPHWAWVTPVTPEIPAVDPGPGAADFPLESPVDRFILAAMRQQGLEPAPPATREEWLRRVTLDLTGLPPTLAEIDAFLADGTDGAHERVVDRLLGTVAHAERMATEWLDVARYGDTYGRHEDFDCVVWPWRDWVIRAYQRNLPFDQFVILQTAGDLLPGATQEEIIPTAFNRLNLQMNEAGSNEEEFRCENVADRVATNGHAFLGLTMECSRCHDHKYDPLTMRDFYAMAGLLGNIDELGLYCRFTNAVPAPSIYVQPEEERRTHEDLRASIAAKEEQREGMRAEAGARFRAWLKTNRPPGQGRPGTWELVRGWFSAPRKEHEPPRPTDAYDFNEMKDRREFSNLMDPERMGKTHKNIRQTDGPEGLGKALWFEDGKDNAAMLPGAGAFRRTDPFTLSAWAVIHGDLDEGPILHRTRSALEAAHRGYEITVEHNHVVFKLAHFWPGNAIAIRSKEPLTVGQWTHLVGTYDGSSRASGLRLYGNGRLMETEVLRDHLYRDIVYLQEWGDFNPEQVADAEVVEKVELTLSGRINSKSFRNGAVDEVRVYDRELSAPEVAQLYGRGGSGGDEEAWLDWYLREIDEPWRAISAEIRRLREEENAIATRSVELMTMREMSPPRQAYLLERGQFNRRQEPVEPGTPAFLPPFPADQPRNRLGYAHWLVDSKHPLTARVAVNRLWQLFFGRGIVSTAEDFGTQGELPSHPELLDWLARRFQDTGWDVRALCRDLVLTSTYRQSTRPRHPEVLKQDPENRWLARAPRLRLTAEQLRDQALAVSGLLNRQVGGPSVRPYQPPGLWEQGGTQHAYRQDHGDKLYRRSLYTFWRRTMPPANLAIFDAPSREYCEMKRPHTSNPLQALVILNDVQFVEAARCFAEKLVQAHPGEGGAGDGPRIREAARSLTGQAPPPSIEAELKTLMAEARTTYGAAPEEARRLVSESGEMPPAAGLDPTEVAATTVMVRTLLAYDGSLSKW